MPTCSKEAKRRRKEEEAMAKATLEREKEAAVRQLQEEAAMATTASGKMPRLVVSPPSAWNLNSLLTGHVGQDTDGTKAEAPRCKYDAATQILTTPRDAQQESVLSNVRSLPFFQDIDAIKWAAGVSKKGKNRSTLPLKCISILAAPAACKLYMMPMTGNTPKLSSLVLNWAWVIRPPQPKI
jgi:hypothetical protein